MRKKKKGGLLKKFFVFLDEAGREVRRNGKMFGILIILVSFAMMIWASQLFWIAYNNSDLVFNYQNLALQLNPHLAKINISLGSVDETTDLMSDGESRTLSQIYHLAVVQSFTSFNLAFISGILFVLGTILISSEQGGDGT